MFDHSAHEVISYLPRPVANGTPLLWRRAPVVCRHYPEGLPPQTIR